MRERPWFALRFVLWLYRTRPYVAEHPLLFTIAVGGVVALLLLPVPLENTSALTEVLPRWFEVVWIMLSGAGGAFIVYSVWTRRPDAEVIGCILLAWVMAVDVVAIWIERGAGAVAIQWMIPALGLGFVARSAFLLVRYPERRKHDEGRQPERRVF